MVVFVVFISLSLSLWLYLLCQTLRTRAIYSIEPTTRNRLHGPRWYFLLFFLMSITHHIPVTTLPSLFHTLNTLKTILSIHKQYFLFFFYLFLCHVKNQIKILHIDPICLWSFWPFWLFKMIKTVILPNIDSHSNTFKMSTQLQ